jgi:iron complex outermembrane receptor protein
LRVLAPVAALLSLVQAPLRADDAARPGEFDAVSVTATRIEAPGFDLPVAVDVRVVDPTGDPQPGLDPAERLGRVPGIVVRNRQNNAQDLQISSRGFGARASFGVRGVRLLQDGIPLTMPDGQGQTGLFDLDSVSRFEVLRGPFAALYGNSAGGVLSVFTEPPANRPGARIDLGAGSFGSRKAGLSAASGTGLALRMSRYETDGYRAHSRTRRDLFGARLDWGEREHSRFSITASVLDQPDTEDPLGLTRAQFDADPRQADAAATRFGTRKSVAHRQLGFDWRLALSGTREFRLRAYGGDRAVRQFLAFAGDGPGASGGVVDLDRGFGGIGLQFTQRGRLAGGPYTLTFGVDHDRMSERRRGFVNDFGSAGALRRDERNSVWNFDQYLIADWWFAERWRLAGGLRRASVHFGIADDFIEPGNPDDSGARTYSATSPVLGLLYALSDAVNLHVSAGRGFETPSFAELAYRPDGEPGPNLGLQASRGTNYELGLKARLAPEHALVLVLFRTATRNDIVPDANVGGRTSFRNAARTDRRGVELSLASQLSERWQGALAYTWTAAELRDYLSRSGDDLSGNALPGLPRQSLYAELLWRERASGLSAALEGRWHSAVWADDANTARAAGQVVANFRLAWDVRAGPVRIVPHLRIDNLFDRRYAGSVIVNAANGRYYEPAPGRAWFAGVRVSAEF